MWRRSLPMARGCQPDVVARCPACGQHATLINLGERLDAAPAWARWARTHTAICLCPHCEAVVEVAGAHERRSPRRAGRVDGPAMLTAP